MKPLCDVCFCRQLLSVLQEIVVGYILSSKCGAIWAPRVLKSGHGSFVSQGSS